MEIKILLLHGPNLNLLGSRETGIYGTQNSEQILEALKTEFSTFDIEYFQSNSESELINKIQDAARLFKGIIFNPGAFSHTSLALADAIRAIKIPVISVHISNIQMREVIRHTDLVADACVGSIAGLGIKGYSLAMDCLLYDHLNMQR